MTEHNNHYWEKGRNGYTPTSSWQEEFESENENKKKYKLDRHLDKVVGKITKLLKEKNKAYGNTALNPSNVFSKLDSSEAICARIDDKLSRIKNRGINDKTEDTVDDLIGYLLLLKMSMEK